MNLHQIQETEKKEVDTQLYLIHARMTYKSSTNLTKEILNMMRAIEGVTVVSVFAEDTIETTKTYGDGVTKTSLKLKFVLPSKNSSTRHYLLKILTQIRKIKGILSFRYTDTASKIDL